MLIRFSSFELVALLETLNDPLSTVVPSMIKTLWCSTNGLPSCRAGSPAQNSGVSWLY